MESYDLDRNRVAEGIPESVRFRVSLKDDQFPEELALDLAQSVWTDRHQLAERHRKVAETLEAA